VLAYEIQYPYYISSFQSTYRVQELVLLLSIQDPNHSFEEPRIEKKKETSIFQKRQFFLLSDGITVV